MSYDRSQSLQTRHLENALDPPPYYRRRLSIKEFLALFVPALLGLVIIIGALQYFIGFGWWDIVLLTVFAYFMYREWYKWSRNHLTCDPEDGVLHVEDHAHPFILFFITGSADDQIPLDDVELDTPTRSFFDHYVFHCCTLIAGERPPLKNVKNVEALLAVQKYRESMKKQAINLDKEQVDVQMAMLETLESMGRTLESMAQDLGSVARLLAAQASAPPAEDRSSWTRPIPIRPPQQASDDDEGSHGEK